MPTPSLKVLTLKVGTELLDSETGSELVANHSHLPTVSDVLHHFLHLQVSSDPPAEGDMIRFFNNHFLIEFWIVLFYSETTELLIKIWLEVGFEKKLLFHHKFVKQKVERIWKDASSAVFGGTQAKRNRLKQKIVDSLESIIDILSCR